MSDGPESVARRLIRTYIGHEVCDGPVNIAKWDDLALIVAQALRAHGEAEYRRGVKEASRNVPSEEMIDAQARGYISTSYPPGPNFIEHLRHGFRLGGRWVADYVLDSALVAKGGGDE